MFKKHKVKKLCKKCLESEITITLRSNRSWRLKYLRQTFWKIGSVITSLTSTLNIHFVRKIIPDKRNLITLLSFLSVQVLWLQNSTFHNTETTICNLLLETPKNVGLRPSLKLQAFLSCCSLCSFTTKSIFLFSPSVLHKHAFVAVKGSVSQWCLVAKNYSEICF